MWVEIEVLLEAGDEGQAWLSLFEQEEIEGKF